MSTCPNGHDSAADDYCDVCGARIGGTPPSVASTSAADSAGGGASAPGAPTTTTADASDDVTCPHCGITQDTGHRFCEVCGADLTTGAPGPRATPPPAATPAGATAWSVEAGPDRAWFDRIGADDVTFPAGAPTRTFGLVDATVLVGRRSDRRGIVPQIDLSDAPEDPGVSHAHCRLVRQSDGAYAVVDSGSTNGTFVNDARDPIPPEQPVVLHDGDRVHIGAFTTLTLHRR
jgi:hypothetical protein